MSSLSALVDMHLEVQDRVGEAADTLRLLPNDDRRVLASGDSGSWPVYVREWTAYGAEIAQDPKIPPTPEQIDRMTEVIGWIAWLAAKDRDEAVIVWFSFAGRTRTNQLARRLRVTRETIRRKRKAGVSRLVERFGSQLKRAA